MSLSSLLVPETKDEKWSSLYANSLNVTDLTVQNIHPSGGGSLIVDDLQVDGNLVVPTGQVLFGSNNFHVLGAPGNPGFVLNVDDNFGNTRWKREFQGNGVIYRPGAASVGNVYGSWVDLIGAVITTNRCLNIYIDDSIISPAMIDITLDCQGRVSFLPYNENAGSGPVIQFATDVQLIDPAVISGISTIVGNTIGDSNIVLSNGSLLTLQLGCSLTNTPGSLLPIIDIADGEAAIIAFRFGAKMETSNLIPIVNVGIGSTLIIAQFEMTQPLGNNVISSTDGTASLILQYDASFTNPWTNAGFTGSITPVGIDKAAGVSYDDSLVSPPLVADTVQLAIDNLKTRSVQFWHFGGDATLAAGPVRLTYNGTSVSYPPLSDTYEVMSRAFAYYDGTVFALTYDTTSGDNTTGMEFLINNVSFTTFSLAGGSGIANIGAPLTQGDYITIRWDFTGTNPGQMNFDLLFLYA